MKKRFVVGIMPGSDPKGVKKALEGRKIKAHYSTKRNRLAFECTADEAYTVLDIPGISYLSVDGTYDIEKSSTQKT
jgi:hypothetical protein